MGSSMLKIRSLISSPLFQTLQQQQHFSTLVNSRAALALLKTQKNPQKIFEICKSDDYTQDSLKTFSTAISRLAALKEFPTIRALVHELFRDSPNLRRDKFIAQAVLWYGKSGMLKDAFDLFDLMHDEMRVPHNVQSFNALLLTCMLHNRFDEVKRIYLSFPLRYGFQMNVDVYNTLIRVFGHSGQWDLGFRLIDEMFRKKVKPNAATFQTLIAGFYNEENFDDAAKVLDLMKEHKLPIGIGMCNTRIHCLCKLKRTDEAKELLDGLLLSGTKPTSITYRYLVHGYAKEEKMDQANDMFEEMVKHGFKPDSDCYFTLVRHMCKGGEFEQAFKVCKQGVEKGWVPNFSTTKMIVLGLAKGSMVQQARELVGQMKEMFPENAHMWDEVKVILSESEDA